MKDHYVAQTYLEAFTNAGGMLVPYYKGKSVVVGSPKPPKAVCFEIDGDANRYFNNPRILDKYLPQFENPWKQNVAALRGRQFDGMIKFQISGYLAFLRTCTPTAKRLNQEATQAALQPMAQRGLERHFRARPPADKETKGIIEKLIREKQIAFEVDRQFPHAVCISRLHYLAAQFVYGTWLVMINESDHPFLTSDNPAVAYYHNRNVTRANIYVPIAPDVALMITPDPDRNKVIDLSVIDDSISPADHFRAPKTGFIDTLNDLIIRAAEDRILHSSIDRNIEQRVREDADWRMAIVVDNIPSERGTIAITRQLPRRRTASESAVGSSIQHRRTEGIRWFSLGLYR